jgi:hypothetical protein
MRQAIVTKYLGPTDHQGARIKATSGGGLTLTVAWDYASDVEDNHQAAANALADKYNWRNPGNGKRYAYVGGSIPGSGFAFVQVETDVYSKGVSP